MFLDREPYIRYWQPTYRVLGPFIRPVKQAVLRVRGIVFGGNTEQLRNIDARLVAMELSQQRFHSAMEQIVLSALADRQTHNAVLDIDQRLAELKSQLAAANSAQWQEIEQLVLAWMGSSNRSALPVDLSSGVPECSSGPESRRAAI